MKAMTEILQTWERIKSFTRLAVTGKVDPDLLGNDQDHIRKQIKDCLFAKVGDIAARSKAIELGTTYLSLSTTGRRKFMKILATDFDIDQEKVKKAINQYNNSEDDDNRIKAEINLAQALVPLRLKLLKQFNGLPNGFKFLVDFRADLLPLRKSDPSLGKLDGDLKRLLTSWFDIELLVLREITWHSPASLLEKLIEYEAVHAIRSWSDLKNRLDSDRQCFAFFHAKMPDEPLIFVEIALVDGISSSIQVLLDEDAAQTKMEDADTAIFYSISNAQRGLKGISLGNFLIKRVVKVLSGKLPGLKQFATLSPVPGFRKWLDPFLETGDESILMPQEIESLKKYVLNTVDGEINSARIMLELLNTNWHNDEKTSNILKPVLMRLCAHYLLEEKRGDKVLDPVANFHLSNGAMLERINWLSDISSKGIKQSAGIMVNYYYKLPEINKNHELYLTESRINASKEVRKWLK